ncbi:PTS-dependent dihydroxyacetone kinase phosphotransferase subunit DhaM [Actinomadura sp. 21ATH]|uniref:PTS-dependent dihydroxyacetone kinase phosphotransferase subunit DhaM n=1 Tax=Actinomadura sp. 21ATH TaxID=1735444 RepID=UPI0035C19234
MVGIVLISHSRTLAEGAAELARTMGVGKAIAEPAGGTADGGMGTGIEVVEDAVERARAAGAGPIVLIADIGSSVMTARLVVDEAEGDVVLADAPLVEGAVAAASTAAMGADLGAVVAAAESAYEHRKS